MGEWIKILGVGGFVLFFVIITFWKENKEEINTQVSSVDQEIVFQQIQGLKNSLYMAKSFKDEEQVLDINKQLDVLYKKAEAIEKDKNEKLLKLKQAEANSEKLLKDAEKEYNKLNEENK